MPVYSLATKRKVDRKRTRDESPEQLRQSDDDSGSDASVASEDSGPSTSAAAQPTGKSIVFSEPSQWVERMALTSTRPLPADLNADDDPKREEAFIQQTLLSVKRGLSMLSEAGVPCKRPNDYYAEMYKTDIHMNDVKQAMEASKARIEAQAHRRSMKDQKRYGKEVQAEVMRQRAKFKRDMQDRLNDWKKKTKGSRGGLNDMLEDGDSKERGGRKGQRGNVAKVRNVKPGGGKRPGKNARQRRG